MIFPENIKLTKGYNERFENVFFFNDTSAGAVSQDFVSETEAQNAWTTGTIVFHTIDSAYYRHIEEEGLPAVRDQEIKWYGKWY